MEQKVCGTVYLLFQVVISHVAGETAEEPECELHYAPSESQANANFIVGKCH